MKITGQQPPEFHGVKGGTGKDNQKAADRAGTLTGSGEPPEWMLEVQKDENKKEIDESTSPSSLVIKGAQTIAAASMAAVNKVSVVDFPQENLDEQLDLQNVENDSFEQPISDDFEENNAIESNDDSNLFDPNLFFSDDTIEKIEPSYDEPSISGLEK